MKYLRENIIQVKSEKDVGIACQIAMEIAANACFDKLKCAEIALSLSEIAGNAVKFAGSGTVKISLKRRGKILEITVQDKGPGIKSIKKAMMEGYSSQKTLGLGLKVAKRAMDEFHIKTKAGRGTKVRMVKYLPITPKKIDYGIMSLPDERYNVNGDAYLIKEFDGDTALLAVIDGLGEGTKAMECANFAKRIAEQNYKAPLNKILMKCNIEFKRIGLARMDVAMGLLLLKPKTIEYAGIGDTIIQVFSKNKITPSSQSGVVGQFMMPAIKLQKFPWKGRIIAILCTDGISAHFRKEDLPLNQDAQAIARFIMSNYRRSYGDATVLVVKRKE